MWNQRIVPMLTSLCVGVVSVLGVVTPAASQSPPRDPQKILQEIQGLAWQKGPTEASIGGLATINVLPGQAFLDAPNTRRFLELNLNPPRDNHYTLAAEDLSWFAVFFFENSGYVKDDEKLDPDGLLKVLKEGDNRGNAERKRLGMPSIHTMGWHVAPHYDATSRRLEWGVELGQDDGQRVVNYTIRMLGRRGVMHVTLVSDPRELDKDILTFKSALGGYEFVAGERYAEFRAGDRVAEYGLAALVLGGAAAAATKTGFGKALFKFIGLGVVALFGVIAAFFRKLRRA